MLLVASMVLAGCEHLDEAGPSSVQITSGTLQISKSLTSWKDIRERNVVMQKFDYSCGAAALATLMQHYFGEPLTEADVLADMIKHLEPGQFEKVERLGFSMLDLKNFAERHGYRAAGVELDIADLPNLKGPVLVYLELYATKHFAVLRGVREDRVYLADPSRGNLRMRIDRFADEWPSGIALVLGKPGFGTPPNTPLAIDTMRPFRTELEAAREGLFALPRRP
jgi:predicted double-glycine peptidase